MPAKLNKWYFVNEEGTKEGPVSKETLFSLLASERISISTLVWTLGMNKYKAMSVVFEERQTFIPPQPKKLITEFKKLHLGERILILVLAILIPIPLIYMGLVKLFGEMLSVEIVSPPYLLHILVFIASVFIFIAIIIYSLYLSERDFLIKSEIDFRIVIFGKIIFFIFSAIVLLFIVFIGLAQDYGFDVMYQELGEAIFKVVSGIISIPVGIIIILIVVIIVFLIKTIINKLS